MKTKRMPDARDLPVYPIRTAAQLTGVDARRIRSWEMQYGLLRPARTRGGHRLFSQRDVETIKRIKHLVDDEGVQLQSVLLLLEVERATDQTSDGDRSTHSGG